MDGPHNISMNSIHTYRTVRQVLGALANAVPGAIVVAFFAARKVATTNIGLEIILLYILGVSFNAALRGVITIFLSLVEVSADSLFIRKAGVWGSGVNVRLPWSDVIFVDDDVRGISVAGAGEQYLIPRGIEGYDRLRDAIRERAKGMLPEPSPDSLRILRADAITVRKCEWLLSRGMTIAAIKLYRDAAGVGLKEAKDAVEALEPHLMRNRIALLNGDVSGQIVEHLRQGRKINAIKLYRESTGQGLKESKDAVEQMERDLASGTTVPSPQILSASPTTSGISDSVTARIHDLVRQNRKIEAIKVYREATGVDLRAAKDYVDGLG